MNKKTKFKLNETLDKALAPPKKTRNLKALDTLLQQFDDGKDLLPNPDQTQPKPQPDRTQTEPRPEPKANQDQYQHPDQDRTQTRPNAVKEKKPKKQPTYKPSVKGSISPVRDYNKRANSLDRDALPSGMFPGASKAIYDALYIRTIGSIDPKKVIQATRKELMEWSGVKNIKTINAHIKRLKDFGLITVTSFVGEQNGSFYEVFLPEDAPRPNPDQTQTQGKPGSNQKTVLVPDQKTVWVGSGKDVDSKNSYETAKTFLKTLNPDDDRKHKTFEKFIGEFENASVKITGKGLKPGEAEKWAEVAKLLVIELELAAARTDSVSSVPGFLREVLRRKIESKILPVKRTGKSISKSLEIGKSAPGSAEPEIWEKENLSEEEKQKTLQIMRERAAEGHRELVMSMEQIYTEADWEWLMKSLSEND